MNRQGLSDEEAIFLGALAESDPHAVQTSKEGRRVCVRLVALGLAVRLPDGPNGTPRFRPSPAGFARAGEVARAATLSLAQQNLLDRLVAAYPESVALGHNERSSCRVLERAGLAAFEGLREPGRRGARATIFALARAGKRRTVKLDPRFRAQARLGPTARSDQLRTVFARLPDGQEEEVGRVAQRAAGWGAWNRDGGVVAKPRTRRKAIESLVWARFGTMALEEGR